MFISYLQLLCYYSLLYFGLIPYFLYYKYSTLCVFSTQGRLIPYNFYYIQYISKEVCIGLEKNGLMNSKFVDTSMDFNTILLPNKRGLSQVLRSTED